jgi:hypothetical protein
LLAFFRFCLLYLPSLLPMASWLRAISHPDESAEPSCAPDELPPYQHDHALAAFEQGDWLAELEVLQLANALQRTAITRGGYEDRAFDLMFAIAEVLESDHGWSFEQSDAWLERMGLWEDP